MAITRTHLWLSNSEVDAIAVEALRLTNEDGAVTPETTIYRVSLPPGGKNDTHWVTEDRLRYFGLHMDEQEAILAALESIHQMQDVLSVRENTLLEVGRNER